MPVRGRRVDGVVWGRGRGVGPPLRRGLPREQGWLLFTPSGRRLAGPPAQALTAGLLELLLGPPRGRGLPLAGRGAAPARVANSALRLVCLITLVLAFSLGFCGALSRDSAALQQLALYILGSRIHSPLLTERCASLSPRETRNKPHASRRDGRSSSR